LSEFRLNLAVEHLQYALVKSGYFTAISLESSKHFSVNILALSFVQRLVYEA